jgi:hypothetical protein
VGDRGVRERGGHRTAARTDFSVRRAACAGGDGLLPVGAGVHSERPAGPVLRLVYCPDHGRLGGRPGGGRACAGAGIGGRTVSASDRDRFGNRADWRRADDPGVRRSAGAGSRAFRRLPG